MTVYADKFYEIVKYLKKATGLDTMEIAERLDFNTDSKIFSFWEPTREATKYCVLDIQERGVKILDSLQENLYNYPKISDEELTNQQIIDWIADSIRDGSDTEYTIGGTQVGYEDGFYIYKMN